MKRDIYKDLKCSHILSLDFIISQLVQVLQHLHGDFRESMFVHMYIFSFYFDVNICAHCWVMLFSCWALWNLTEQTPELLKCDLSFFCNYLIFQWLVNPYLTMLFVSGASSRPLTFRLVNLFVCLLFACFRKER